MSPTRRAALAALAGLGGSLAIPTAISAAPSRADPIPDLLAERRCAIHAVNVGLYATEDEAEALMDRWSACDAAAITSPATTPAGAAASLEWAREELLQFGFDVHKTDDDARIVLALLDGALGVLRGIGGVP